MVHNAYPPLPEPADEAGFTAPYMQLTPAPETERRTGTLADAVQRHKAAEDRAFEREVDELNAQVERDDAQGDEARTRANAVLSHARQELRIAQIHAESAREEAEPFYRAVGSALGGRIRAIIGLPDAD